MHHTIAHRCPPAPADPRVATPRTAQQAHAPGGRSRLIRIAVLAAIVLGTIVLGTAGPAATATRAQDESVTPREEPMLDDPDSWEPATPRAPSAANTETRSLLDTLVEGGFVGLLIGLLSVAALGFIIEHSITIRKSVLMPEAVADELETLIQQGEIEAAIEACGDAHNESLIGRRSAGRAATLPGQRIRIRRIQGGRGGSGRGPDGPPLPQDRSARRDRCHCPDARIDGNRFGHD
jgi:hypothetical protein